VGSACLNINAGLDTVRSSGPSRQAALTDPKDSTWESPALLGSGFNLEHHCKGNGIQIANELAASKILAVMHPLFTRNKGQSCVRTTCLNAIVLDQAQCVLCGPLSKQL